MNRAKRRAAQISAPETIRLFAAAYACPDCNSENELTTAGGNVFRLEVRHDSTCPFFARIERRTP